ncbi:MAG: N-formylglutamate amidohydrolase [Balneolaceae bacterium]
MLHKPTKFLITCEHATNALPEEWAFLFENSAAVLETHRGWDPGALQLAETIANELDATLHHYPWSRLLIEPNRSLHHQSLFSEFTKKRTKSEKEQLVQQYWTPYRNRVREVIQKMISSNRVVHISVHTFTPVLKGVNRSVDIGLLYDPKRKDEQEFCREWKKRVKLVAPKFKMRMNQPYKGSADGFTTSLRNKFLNEEYLGIELEVNQKFWFENKAKWMKIAEMLAGSLSRS